MLIADLEALLAKTQAGEWDYNLTHLVMAKLPAILTALRAAEAFYKQVESDDYHNETPVFEEFRAALAALGEGPREGKS